MKLRRAKMFNVPYDLVPTMEEINELDIFILTINKDGRKRATMTFEFTEKNNRFTLRNRVKFIHKKKDSYSITGEKKILKKLKEIKCTNTTQ